MALVLIGSIAAITDAVAASLVSGATATRSAVDARVRVGTADAVADAIANNPDVIAAAVASAQSASGQLLYRGVAGAESTNFDDLYTDADQGWYRVPESAASALGLPTTERGNVTVFALGGNGWATQEWDPASGVKQRRMRKNGVWSAWTTIGITSEDAIALVKADTTISQYRGTIGAESTNLNSMYNDADQGWYRVPASASLALGLPVEERGVVKVLALGGNGWAVQEWEPASGLPLRRSRKDGVWTPWTLPGITLLASIPLTGDWGGTVKYWGNGGSVSVMLDAVTYSGTGTSYQVVTDALPVNVRPPSGGTGWGTTAVGGLRWRVMADGRVQIFNPTATAVYGTVTYSAY